MQTPEPGMPVTFPLNGRNYRLRYPLRILKRMHAETGISILQPGTYTDIQRDPAKLAMVVYYGMLTENPDVTMDFVEDNIEIHHMRDLAPAVFYAMTGKTFEQVQAPLPNESTAPETLGSPSGPSDVSTSILVNGISGT